MTGLVIVRALNLVCGAIALGIPAVLALAVLPAFAGRDAAGAPLQALLKPLVLLTWAALAVGLLSGLAWLVFQAASMSGLAVSGAATPAILGRVVWRTHFGNVLLLRLVLALVMAVLLVLLQAARSVRAQRAALAAATVAAAAGFCALAWAGHAVATPGILHLVADAAHLLAAGVWLGGLVVLVVLFAPAPRPAAWGWSAAVAEATRRFSPIGVACVGTLLATGLVNSWFLVGTVPALVGTEYGRLLLVKLALFGLMVALAAVNRFRLTPRLGPAGGAQGSRRIAADAAATVRALRRNAIAEAALGGLVLAVVSALGAVPPGLHDQPWWPFPWRFSGEAMALPAVRDEIFIAAALVATGTALCVLGLARRRHRLPAIPVGLALVACFVPSFRLLTVDAYPTSFYQSPVAYTTASLERGARLFAENCTQCHGERGKGDGPAKATLATPPADLTAAHVLEHRVGELFWWLSQGVPETGMPGFAEALGEDERWDLVNWVRTLPVAGLDEGLVTEVGSGPAPPAPDFSYVGADGTAGSLQALLARGPLLLVLFTPADSAARLRRLEAADKMLSDAGLGILAVPVTEGAASALRPRFVATADASVALAYRVIASVPRYDLAMAARHLEFLIDRDGYVRALWIPEETSAWDDPRSLVQLVGQLARRPLASQSVAAHLHTQ